MLLPEGREREAMAVQPRAVLHKAHRWVGLTLGMLFALAGVTGGLLLFQPQFFRWAHGSLIPPGLSEKPGSIDRWVQNARAAVPDLHGPLAVWPPRVSHNLSDAGMLLFSGRAPGGFGNTGFAAVLVAPESGAVLGVIDVDRSPAYAPLFLHRQLWAGRIGALLIGIMGLASLALAVIGVCLWWPRRGGLLRKLSPRPWRATFLRAAPLHQWVGIWMVPLLLVLAGTGVYLAKPAWVAPVLSIVAGERTQSEHDRRPAGVAAGEQGSACASAIRLDTALARAQALVPGSHFVGISPYDRDTLRRWRIDLQTDSEALFRQTYVLADLACGTVAVKNAPAQRSPRLATELWLISLHDGTAFGTTGQIVVSMAGLIPLLLAWSGFRMWLRRRGARNSLP